VTTPWTPKRIAELRAAHRNGLHTAFEALPEALAEIERLQAERDKLWLFVYWAIGTTEAAISEITDDEDDVEDAKDKLVEMKQAIGLDPERDSWEQDPQTYTKVEQERLAIIMRRKENT
jgi:hypothetical protein